MHSNTKLQLRKWSGLWGEAEDNLSPGETDLAWNTDELLHYSPRGWREQGMQDIYFVREKENTDFCQNRDQEIRTSEDWQDSRGCRTWSIPDFGRTWHSKYGNLQWMHSNLSGKAEVRGTWEELAQHWYLRRDPGDIYEKYRHAVVTLAGGTLWEKLNYGTERWTPGKLRFN